jgi:hypothetical protein
MGSLSTIATTWCVFTQSSVALSPQDVSKPLSEQSVETHFLAFRAVLPTLDENVVRHGALRGGRTMATPLYS